MRAIDLIERKRDGGTLSDTEIAWLIDGYVRDEVPDYQMAAWAMAVYLRGMTTAETTALTLAMAQSGTMLDLRDIAPVVVDKHSTGGVGDKTTLVLVPLLAAIGLPVAKMSGRGLGFSGGTIDKLESIPGFRTDLNEQEIRAAVQRVGLVVTAQTGDLAPADKKLYALRDVTGTVASIPLIAASIMCKKIAAGTTHVALDVKYGSGAFMRDIASARELAQTMVSIGHNVGRHMIAVLSSMEQPLGYAVGNALEVAEAIEALQAGTPPDLLHLCIEIAAHLAVLTGRVPDYDAALVLLQRAHQSGQAWQRFREMVAQQGGDLAYVDEPQRLPRAPVVVPFAAPRSGYVVRIEAQELGVSLNELGGGRTRKGDPIDPAVGLVIRRRVGDYVQQGDPLVAIHARSHADAEAILPRLTRAYSIAATPVPVPPLIAEIVTPEQV